MSDWIQDVDDQVLQWFLDHHTRFLNHNLLNITALGSTTILALVALCALGALLLNGQYRQALLAVLVLVGVYFATNALKAEVARVRPVIGKGVIPTPHSASFPSSHASLALTVYLVVALCLPTSGRQGHGRRFRIYGLAWALALTLLIGLSRLYLGVHFLSDVVGGWLLGLGFVLLFWMADRLTRGQPAER